MSSTHESVRGYGSAGEIAAALQQAIGCNVRCFNSVEEMGPLYPIDWGSMPDASYSGLIAILDDERNHVVALIGVQTPAQWREQYGLLPLPNEQLQDEHNEFWCSIGARSKEERKAVIRHLSKMRK